METNNTEALELAIKEQLEDQAKTNQLISDLITAVNQLRGDFNGINNKLDNLKVNAPTVDTAPIEKLIRTNMVNIALTIAGLPKRITKNFQILLFPEQDAKLFYKIVFGRWFLWLVIMWFGVYIYKWGMHHSDNNKELMMEALRENKVIKAWDYLYRQGTKTHKRAMDSALIIVDRKATK